MDVLRSVFGDVMFWVWWIGASVVLYAFASIFFRLWASILPPLPLEVVEKLREVMENTAEGNFPPGDADIYSLDYALARAERERPGSTFRLYVQLPRAKAGRAFASIMCGFMFSVVHLGYWDWHWTMIPGLLFAVFLYLTPVQLWGMSRPRT